MHIHLHMILGKGTGERFNRAIDYSICHHACDAVMPFGMVPTFLNGRLATELFAFHISRRTDNGTQTQRTRCELDVLIICIEQRQQQIVAEQLELPIK